MHQMWKVAYQLALKAEEKLKRRTTRGAPKVIGDRPLQSGEERDPFSLPSIYMARFTNIIESQGSILLVAQSLDLSIVQALKAPSGHGHNYYGKAWKQATSAYRRELGLAWLVVPAHFVSPALGP